MKNILILFTLLFSFKIFAAPPVILEEEKEIYPIGIHLDILEDIKGNLTIKDIVSPDISKQFVPNKVEIPNFGYTSSVYWVRMQLQSKMPKRTEWFLEMGYPNLDYIDFYIPLTNGDYIVKHTGDMLPFNKRDIIYHNFIFRLSIQTGQKQTIYLRYKSKTSMQFPLTLWSTSSFTEKINKEVYAFGLYYGIMLVMILYNLFIYIFVRDKSYLYYVLYITSFTVLQMCLNGLAYEYFWPNFTWVGNHAIPFFIGFACFSILQFAINFLQTSKNAPIVNKIMIVFSWIAILITGLSLFAKYSIVIKPSVILAIITPVLALLAGILSLKNKYRPARFYMIAWSFFLIGAILYPLKAFGVVPSTFITEYALQIGSALLVILLSLGLADRINDERRQKFLAQREALENEKLARKIQQEATYTLERKVNERTQELQTLNQELENNNIKLLKISDALWGEMQIAKKIQTMLLPENPTISGFEILAYMEPADEVGGDYFDIINTDKTDWITIGDVSGHGVPSGLVMMMVQSCIRSHVVESPDIKPSELLRIVNKTIGHNIKKMSEEKFMTITTIALRGDSNAIFSGRHEDILIYRADNNDVESIKTDGICLSPWGLGNEGVDIEFKLNKGDVLFVYTDGITEAVKKSTTESIEDNIRNMFGIDGLINILNNYGEKSISDIKNAILFALKEYEIDDDISFVLAKKV